MYCQWGAFFFSPYCTVCFAIGGLLTLFQSGPDWQLTSEYILYLIPLNKFTPILSSLGQFFLSSPSPRSPRLSLLYSLDSPFPFSLSSCVVVLRLLDTIFSSLLWSVQFSTSVLLCSIFEIFLHAMPTLVPFSICFLPNVVASSIELNEQHEMQQSEYCSHDTSPALLLLLLSCCLSTFASKSKHASKRLFFLSYVTCALSSRQ